MAEKRTAESIRKITIKAVVGEVPDVEALLKAPEKRKDLCTIYGVVRRSKPDSSDYGDFVRFYGQFKGVNLGTGEVFMAPQAILPGIVQDQLYGAMAGGEGAGEVQFAVKIGVKYDKTAATKYLYTAESLMPIQESDALTMLENSLKEQKALPAPKK